MKEKRGGVDVYGGLLDDLGVVSPFRIDTGGVGFVVVNEKGKKGVDVDGGFLCRFSLGRIAMSIRLLECRSLDGGISDSISDLCSRRQTNQSLID